jgi:hypothetical protein
MLHLSDTYVTYTSFDLRYIGGEDIIDDKFGAAQKMGATECVNSITCEVGFFPNVTTVKRIVYFTLIYMVLRWIYERSSHKLV